MCADWQVAGQTSIQVTWKTETHQESVPNQGLIHRPVSVQPPRSAGYSAPGLECVCTGCPVCRVESAGGYKRNGKQLWYLHQPNFTYSISYTNHFTWKTVVIWKKTNLMAGRSSGREGEDARERSVSSSAPLPSWSSTRTSLLARLSTSPSSEIVWFAMKKIQHSQIKVHKFHLSKWYMKVISQGQQNYQINWSPLRQPLTNASTLSTHCWCHTLGQTYNGGRKGTVFTVTQTWNYYPYNYWTVFLNK